MNAYLILKPLHVSFVLVSYSLFLLRGIWMLRASPRLQRRWVRVLPHVNDTLLLASGITLAVLTHQSPGSHPWLAAKIAALLVYIGLGTVALKRRQLWAWLAAQAVFFYIVAVAVTRNPLPFLR
jgi:uncharacterized membrane protein SirB2